MADVPQLAPSRSFRRAVADLTDGWRQRALWGYLGWQDIRQRYRRSTLGPLWITISMGVTAVALGLLYSQLFNVPSIGPFLLYVTTGLIVWSFISGCVEYGADVFIENEGLIRHLPAPISLHVYRLVWRQTLFFVHNLAVYLVMAVIFPQHLNWTLLLVLPAFALLMLNGIWIALVVGIISTRFRDLPPVTKSLIQLMFFMTPIVWVYDDLLSRGGRVAERARLAEFNPFLHFIEIIRRPLLGQSFEPRYWIVTIAITAVGWLLALVFMRNYRARVSYWV